MDTQDVMEVVQNEGTGDALPPEVVQPPPQPVSSDAVAHRRKMLAAAARKMRTSVSVEEPPGAVAAPDTLGAGGVTSTGPEHDAPEGSIHSPRIGGTSKIPRKSVVEMRSGDGDALDEAEPLINSAREEGVDVSTAALLYDPTNIQAVQDALERVDEGAEDFRVTYENEIFFTTAPQWVHRWNAIRLYSNTTLPSDWILDQQQQQGLIANASGVGGGPAMMMTASDQLDASMKSALQKLKSDIAELQRLKQEVTLGFDGGMFHQSSRQVEAMVEEREQVYTRRHNAPFWIEKGSALRCIDESIMELTESMELIVRQQTRLANRSSNSDGQESITAPAPLTSLQHGELRLLDGTQVADISSATSNLQLSLMERVVAETVSDTNVLWARRVLRDEATAEQQRLAAHTTKRKKKTRGGEAEAAASVPTPSAAAEAAAPLQRCVDVAMRLQQVPLVHDSFVIAEPQPEMDPSLLQEPDMLSNPQSLSEKNFVRRSYTIHIQSLRFRDRREFIQEQYFAAQLLDAYEQYQLLITNLRQDVKSRSFYRQLLQSLENSQGAATSMISAAGPPSATARFMTSQVAQHMQLVRELLSRSTEMERTCLMSMLDAWRGLSHVRETQMFTSVRLQLLFRRHGDVVSTYGGQITGAVDPSQVPSEGILGYVPIVTEAAAAALPGPPPAQAPSVSLPLQSVAPMTPILPNVKILIYAKTNKSMPPLFVGSTELRPLNTSGTAHYNESFELRTAHDPTELLLHVVEDSTISSTLSVTRIPASTSPAALILPFQTGVFFADPGTGAAKEVNGVISVATTWTTASGLSIEAIERLFIRGEADPLDPRNERYVEILRKHYTETSTGVETPAGNRNVNPDGTPLSPRSKNYHEGDGGLFYLAKPQELSTRLMLLQKRWKVLSGAAQAEDEMEANLVDVQIPADDVMAKKLNRELRKKVAEGKATQLAGASSDITSAMSPRGFANSYNNSSAAAALIVTDKRHRQWQEKVRNRKLMYKNSKKISDHELLSRTLVIPPLPTFGGLFRIIVDSLSPSSNLNPKRENRAEVSQIDRTKLVEMRGSSHIIVHVMKATNLPFRVSAREEDIQPPAGSSEVPAALKANRLLEPFVQAMFVSHSSYSRTEVGNNPSWFQSLKVPFDPIDFEEETLSLMDDDIVIGVYDKVQVDLPPASVTLGAAPRITHFRVERRLLGTVKIPFYTLYNSEKASLEGQFTLDVPRYVMGYEVPQDFPPSIQLYIALSPPLRKKKENEEVTWAQLSVLPVPLRLQLLHQEAFTWKQYAEITLQQIRAENPLASWRNVEPFVTNSNGDPTFICRYILPNGSPPPPTVKTVANAVRFVSLMHFQVDILTWGDRDVWSTNVEFLSKKVGDYEELALLLIHFLRHLAPNEGTMLVLGKGDVYHQAAYVLHTVAGVLKLIDPRTGVIRDVHNPYNSLSEVSCVVSHNQIWANIQLSGSPYRMLWDLNDNRYWTPLMTSANIGLADAIEPVQRTHLKYEIPPDGITVKLEADLKKALKKALRAWRNDRQPTYQERVGSMLRDVLDELEREKRECANYQQTFVEEAHERALREFGAEYICVGNPVEGSYDATDPEFLTILDKVRETVVHSIGTDSVRYGVATYAYAYTADTIALWAYLVALVPRRVDR